MKDDSDSDKTKFIFSIEIEKVIFLVYESLQRVSD